MKIEILDEHDDCVAIIEGGTYPHPLSVKGDTKQVYEAAQVINRALLLFVATNQTTEAK